MSNDSDSAAALAPSAGLPITSADIIAAVKTLGQAPFGKFLLILAALGLAAFGAYSFVRSRYGRM